MNVEITVNTRGFDRKMADLPVRLAAAKRRALMDIGQLVASRATLAFRTSQFRPSPWAPRKPSKRDDGHPLLIKSGHLRQSIAWTLDGADGVVIGSSQKYAGYHQFGTKDMPARPFFPLDANGRLVPAMERKIVKTVEKVVREEQAKLN